MIDLDKLSYRAYGNLVIIVLTIIALLFNLFPFSLIGFVICEIQIPIYLFVRNKFEEPIHAYGLNICFVVTILFYVLLYLMIGLMTFLLGRDSAMIFATILNIGGCYATSTVPNVISDKGKLFFGYKKHDDSKYSKLINFIKYNGLDKNLIEAEERLKEVDTIIYLVYKRKFREDKTFKEISEEFDIENPRIVEILDKAYFYIIGALKI
jgi:hypothetical protein